MAFSFGNSASFGSSAQPPFGSTSSQATFGNNPTRPGTGFTSFGSAPSTSFGSAPSTSFGSAPSTSFGSVPSTSFGAFGSTFSTSNTTTPSLGFGAGFGAQPSVTSAVSSFGNLFGTSGLTTSSAFGSSFGTPTSTSSSFGSAFPSAATQNLFGSGASKSFGTPTSNLFSTPLNLFSAPNQTTGWFGSTSTAPGTFSNTSAMLPSNPFGQSSNPTQAPGVFGNNTGFGTSFFTQSAAYPAQSMNQNNLTGLPPTAIGHMYGSPSLMEPLFYNKTALNSTKLHQVYTSVYAINVFNDERDDILKKWNMLQACWGFGKGYYNVMMPPIEYTPETPFYLFRAVGYNQLPHHVNSDGIVLLLFDKPYNELKGHEEALRNGITGVLGNKPYLTVDVIEIKAFNDTQTKVKIVVYEKSVTGFTRKIPAFDLATFLNLPMQKQQLNTVGVVFIIPVVTSSRSEVKEYLRKVPLGVDTHMWHAAIQDNPDIKHSVPIIINGFAGLHSRMLFQENQLALQHAFIVKTTADMKELHQKATASISHMLELKHRYQELQHRILKLIVKQEFMRNHGMAMSPLEEIIRARLETLNFLIHHPKYFKISLPELLSSIKLLHKNRRKAQKSYVIPQDVQGQIMAFLKLQHQAMTVLVKTIQIDVKALTVICFGYDADIETPIHIRRIRPKKKPQQPSGASKYAGLIRINKPE